MSLLHVLRQAPFNVRSTLCQLFNSILYHTPEDVMKISALAGWEVMFFYLLTPFSSQVQSPQTTPVQSDSPTQDSEPNKRYSINAPFPTNESSSESRESPDATPSRDNSSPLKNSTSDAIPPFIPEHSAPEPMQRKHSDTYSHSNPPDNTCVVSIHDKVCMEKPNPRDLNLPLTKYRSRTSGLVTRRPSSRRDYVITPSKELFETGNIITRKEPSVASTPWMETVDNFVDEEMTRTVDVVIQMIKQVMWVPVGDLPSWKVIGERAKRARHSQG